MCLSPITIVNPTKYISLAHRDQFLLQVPCGHCAECSSVQSSQWFYRSWYEFNDCLNNGGFVYFDTMTYKDSHLPMASDYIGGLPFNFSCFSHRDLRLFNVDLATTIRRKYKGVKVRYFMSSEYGSLKHRPHYHYLFYVTGKIDPLDFSRLVAKKWKHGRTDGLPYQSRNYVNTKNVIRDASPETRLRVCNYVTKYVQKSCEFDKYINRRIDSCMKHIAKKYSYLPKWKESRHSRRVRESLKRCFGQFHRQSQFFGASALGDIDLNQLFKDGCLFMPHFKGVKVPVPLPMYYKRKLFQEQVEVNGVKCWQDTELGKEYRKARKTALIKDMQEKFSNSAFQFDYKTSSHLADYVFNRRGRIIAPLDESTISERLEKLSIFSYNHRSDLERFGYGALYDKFHGTSKQYTSIRGSEMKLQDFIDTYVYFDNTMESLLDQYYSCCERRNTGKQRAFALKQRLTDIHKNLC